MPSSVALDVIQLGTPADWFTHKPGAHKPRDHNPCTQSPRTHYSLGAHLSVVKSMMLTIRGLSKTSGSSTWHISALPIVLQFPGWGHIYQMIIPFKLEQKLTRS